MASLTRRLFLRGAAVVAPLAALPVVAAAAESYVEENPALLALEAEIDRAASAHRSASDAYWKAHRLAKSLWQRAPETITYTYIGLDANCERDFTGHGYGDNIAVWPASLIRYRVEAQKRWRKMTPDREEARRRASEELAAAEKYEAACSYAKEASQIEVAEKQRKAAIDELARVARLAHAEPARTMAGVKIKAKVLQEWGRVEPFYRMLTVGAPDWSAGLASSLLEVLEV